MRALWVLMIVAAMSLWTGCKSGDDDDDGDTDESSEEGDPTVIADCEGTIPAFEAVAAFDKCVECHDSMKTGAAARMAAPQTINFDTESAAMMHAVKAAQEVEEGKMPPANSNITLTASEKEDLIKWALCSE